MTTLTGLFEGEDEEERFKGENIRGLEQELTQLDDDVIQLENQWRNRGLIEFPDEDHDNELHPFFYEGFEQFLQEIRDEPEEKEDDEITKENVYDEARAYHVIRRIRGDYPKPGVSHYILHGLERVAAGAMLVVALPVIGAAALAVKVSDPSGSAFYLQDRVMKDGLKEEVKKVRSIKQNTRFYQRWQNGEHENKDPFRTIGTKSDSLIEYKGPGLEFMSYLFGRTAGRKIRDGIKVGAFIRKYRLDELPQLWNVVKGNMSLVGPRPITADSMADVVNAAIDKYGSPDMAYDRCSVRQGLVGPAQFKDTTKLPWHDRLYIEKKHADNYHSMNPVLATGKCLSDTVGVIAERIGNKILGRANEYLGNAA